MPTAGGVIHAQDVDLPDSVSDYGAGANSITSATFAVLPTNTCDVIMNNPHPTAQMECLVCLGGWLTAASGDVRGALDFSGATVIAAGVGGAAAIGWGEVLYSGDSISGQRHTTYPVLLNPGDTTVAVHAYRTGAGAVALNYPTLRVIPLRYVL